ncbi:UDP-4-amino-4,6-dideoxy-N-acetyl-beta-L-altrosamine N-acetyltransferase [Helicobacter muridarum]|uniref:Flagellar modification protein FlaG/FlmH n=1 Tax=Helicobacter muridarum TaxID=216 RepID=A0A377PVX7_9HELI|nr:UDP-4-amino-4,6-dideoxy-N-acetyl-beta-L-altrosamine N-acetyltransferase [Helicobacter muridarum]TLE00938.1 UDP-4-amino-4,6-dideoxy-N-acetyl-beta-L-altrosamine N-acetyltransferase [Helicobacter muridarum]STQ86717.1 flagellar modification protein FlaG/FlmH [Helicobacter muridarum]
MKIRILTESIKGLGLGHVARCYTLGLIFLEMGYEIDFFVRGNADFIEFLETQKNNISKDSNIKKDIMKNFYPLPIAWECLKHKELVKSDIYIIDSYEINDFSSFLSDAKILVLFDDDGRHLSLLKSYLKSKRGKAKLFLLNPNGLYQKQGLDEILKDHILTGLEYAMIRPCFHKALESMSKKEHQERRHITVCFGGEDSQDMSNRIFNILEKLNSTHELDLSINIIIGANYKGKLLKSTHFKKPNSKNSNETYNIYQNIPQDFLATCLAKSEYSIVSGGGILFEAAMLAQNTLAIELASNQKDQIELMEEKGLVRKLNHKNLKEDIEYALLNPKQDTLTYNKHDIGTKIIDFANRLVLESINVALQINHISRQKHKNFTLNGYIAINFCNISQDEALRVLRYRNNPIISENMYGSDHISEKTHFNFIASLMKDEQSKYFLVQDSKNMQDIGVISLNRINIKHKNAYLGIYKNPEARTKNKTNKISYGTMLMDLLKHIAFCEYKLHMLYLEVIASNIQAIRFYEKEGFAFMGELIDGFSQHKNKAQKFCNVLVYGIKNETI